MKTKEEIARSAANEWCRCFKCDGVVHDKGEPFYKCKQPCETCRKWYDAYRGALLALDLQKMNDNGLFDLSLQVD